jgi:iron complex transport system permease protein
VQWTLGSLDDNVRWARLALVGSLTLVGIGAGVFLGPAMDASSLSDDEARAVGVRLGALRITLFILAGALTSGTVLLAGPIAFVGLVIPHLVRALAGPSHRTVVLASAFAGAALIVMADSLVRVIDLGSGRMPIGVLTALVGGPVFLVILLRSRPGGTV